MKAKRKKASRYRASKTHGCGSMKKRRGKGNKGGSGNAGSGKRADQKKPSFWKNSLKKGFTSHKERTNSINTQKLERLISNNKIKQEEGVYDLTKVGIDKLIAKGKISKELKIKVKLASKRLIENFKKEGGEILLESK